MLRVLQLINYLGHGGTEMSIFNTIEAMDNSEVENIIAYSEGANGVSLFENAGYKLIKVNMPKAFSFNAALELKKLCKLYSIDVIHTHFLRENSIAVLSKLLGNRVKLINSRHMLTDNSKPVQLINKLLSYFNNTIVAVSNVVRNKLIEENISPSKIKVIPNGLDPSIWSCKASLDLHNKYEIRKNIPIVCSIARFSEEKGHEFFIRAIDSYTKKYGNEIAFLLVGDGPLLESTKEQVKALGLDSIVFFAGFQNNVKEILCASDVFVCHSRSEAFGISILEAMACSKPVIATQSGGTIELAHSKDTGGYLIDYGDLDDFCDTLYELVKDEKLRTTLGEEGRLRFEEKFSIEKTSNSTLKIYKD